MFCHAGGKLAMERCSREPARCLRQHGHVGRPTGSTAMDNSRLRDPAIHLISPPPEESLRRLARAHADPARPSSPPAAKRKRAVPATTPNPRSRKQQREDRNGENAPPPSPTLAVRTRRSRSATPIPPYEPPTDIFTPPREVLVSPTIRVSKSSKRKSVQKKKRSPPPLAVKLEMPDIDLTAPMPPPSPGDDPLLLTGPSSSPTRPRGPAFSEADLLTVQKDVATAAPVRRTTSPTPLAFVKKLRFDDLPPSSPPQVTVSSPTLDDQMPLFDWSDSDTDDLPILSEPVSEPQDGQGDYTGKWKDVFIRTKADPPPIASKEDKWPFPLSLEKAPPFALAHREDDDDQVNAGPDPFDFSSIPDHEPARQVSPELGQVELVGQEDQPAAAHEQSPEPAPVDHDFQHPDEERHSSEERASEHASDEERHSSEERVSEHASDQGLPSPEPPSEDHPRQTESPAVNAEDDDNSSSDADDEPDIVKITSADPRAAARAAAILKQHNYDCFTRKELKKKYSDAMRRRSSGSFELARAVFEGGVRKRRRTIGGMGVRGENVFIPGSPATTLPNLLKEVQAEVSREQSPFPSCNSNASPPNPFKTPLPNRNSPFLFSGLGLTPKVPMTPGETCYDPLTGERMWTKEEWKRLDACFTDERLQVGATLGIVDDDGLASVDLVERENVLARFVEWMGGEEAVAEYGPDWSRYDSRVLNPCVDS